MLICSNRNIVNELYKYENQSFEIKCLNLSGLITQPVSYLHESRESSAAVDLDIKKP